MVQKDWISSLTKTLYITILICVDDTLSSSSNQSSLEKRSSLQLMGSLGGDTGFSGGGSSSLKDPCGYVKLSQQTWMDLGIDDYLKNYPNGDKFTLQEFVAELNVPIFFCGVGMQCQAGQICSPAVGINWIILYAAQEWNNYMNSLYQAVDSAIALMQDASSSIVSDFTSVIPPNDQLYGWTVADVVCGVLGSLSAILVPAFIPADAVLAALAEMAGGTALVATAEMAIGRTKDTPPPGQQAYNAARAAIDSRNLPAFDRLQTEKDQADIHNFFRSDRSQTPLISGPPHSTTSESSYASSPSSGSVAESHHLHGHREQGSSYFVSEPSSPRGQDSHSDGKHQRERRSIIKHKDGNFSTYAYLATMTPILSQGGLAEILRGGMYLNPNPDTNDLQQSGKALAQITTLGQLFQSLDDCNSKGPNGAWDKKDELSYCTPEGLMMNIIQAQQTTSINKIQNAHLLKEKYGYTTEFLARSAWDCQKNAPPPMNMQSDCIFPIAVCDCTTEAVAKLRKKKTTVEACRIGANLPI